MFYTYIKPNVIWVVYNTSLLLSDASVFSISWGDHVLKGSAVCFCVEGWERDGGGSE